MQNDAKIVKYLMENDIYIKYFEQNQRRISVNIQNLNIISKTYSEVDLWMRKVYTPIQKWQWGSNAEPGILNV